MTDQDREAAHSVTGVQFETVPFCTGDSGLQRLSDTPVARFAYVQPGFEEIPSVVIYQVIGGPSDGSSVSAETLVALGIPIPDPVTA